MCKKLTLNAFCSCYADSAAAMTAEPDSEILLCLTQATTSKTMAAMLAPLRKVCAHVVSSQRHTDSAAGHHHSYLIVDLKI